jgi:hypothetical protein
VRLFSPKITDRIRADLVGKELFSELVYLAGQATQDLPVLKITLSTNTFLTANLGNNAWVTPYLILDGLILPLFGGVLVASLGRRVDTGACCQAPGWKPPWGGQS